MSEKPKEMFDEAMTHGYIEARDIKALICGAAGMGKTHTIALLMDEEPSVIRHSTPCATRPVKVDKLEKEGGKCVRVSHDQLSQMLADVSRHFNNASTKTFHCQESYKLYTLFQYKHIIRNF